MTGIEYKTDDKGRKGGVLIALKKHGAIWEGFWDGLVSESSPKGKRRFLRAVLRRSPEPYALA